MIDNGRHAYLDALGIDVWQLRKPVRIVQPVAGFSPGLKLGPGTGGTLFICAADSESASKLANDISRSLGGKPVWAWPVSDAGAVTLQEAVKLHLFTTLAIFGNELVERFFGGGAPASLLTSKIVVLPAMRDLEEQANARRALWNTMCQTGMVSTGEDPA